MAGNLSDYAESQVVAWLFSTDSITRPTSWYVALYTTEPDDTGGGVEVSTGGYTRQSATFADQTGGVYANNAQISFDATGAPFGTVVAVGVFDASSAGNLLAWKTVTSQSVADGQSARFASGAITVRFD